MLHYEKIDSMGIRTHNHIVHKRTLNYLAKLGVPLRTKWLWVRILLLSLKLQIWRLPRARSSLTFRQTIECRFTLKLVRDMIITYRTNQCWESLIRTLESHYWHATSFIVLRPRKAFLGHIFFNFSFFKFFIKVYDLSGTRHKMRQKFSLM